MKIIWYPAVSLDGFIATPGGDSDWVAEPDDRQFRQLVKQSGALIVGRRTHDQYKAYGNPFPTARTYVLTADSALASDDPAVVYVTGGPLEVMRRLHADGYQQAVLSGGGDTNGQFVKAGVVDEAWISHYPLSLGSGIPLLGRYPGQLRLELLSSQTLTGGIVHNRYRVG